MASTWRRRLLARHVDGDLHEVAHDLLDVAADIADLGELGGLDLDERRLRQLGEAARDLGLADAGGADHQDVLGQHLLAQLLRQLLAAPAVAQRDGDGALGVVLADDVAVELGDDLARAEAGRGLLVRRPRGGRRVVVHRLLEQDVAVGVDADVGGDLHGLARDVLGREGLAVDERAGGGEREAAAGADADEAVLRLQHVAGAREHEADLLVGDRHHGLEPAQVAIGAPVLGQLDAGARELVRMLLELGLQPLEEGEGVGGGAGETGDHVALADAAHLLGVGLDDGVTQGYLAVAGHHDLRALADAEDGGAVPLGRFIAGHTTIQISRRRRCCKRGLSA